MKVEDILQLVCLAIKVFVIDLTDISLSDPLIYYLDRMHVLPASFMKYRGMLDLIDDSFKILLYL